MKVHPGWAEFLEAYDCLPSPKRLVAFTKFASTHYAMDGTYKPGDMLVFGAETHGLPDEVALCYLLTYIYACPSSEVAGSSIVLVVLL